jgi:outer membrane receptor protein involved in Fe transport
MKKLSTKTKDYMRNTITLFLFLMFTSAVAFAQSPARISGQVQEGGNKALGGVTVTLLKAKDSSLAKVAISDKAGNYEFEQLKAGTYLLTFTHTGFEKKTTAAFELAAGATVQQPAIVLEPATQGLSGVTVQARRPLVENKIDKMVVNVDASPTNAGANALEVLEKSPGISVDRDGNISIKGKQGVIVLMDGKPTHLSGQDLANLLRNMPANQLDQVEIMTQPSAKYDASGNSGILNLRTKKSLAKGFNGSINLSYVQGRYPKSPNSFSFNYRNAKINLFTNLSYSYWSGFNDQQLVRKFRNNGVLTSVFDQQADQKHHGNNFTARVGLDYTLDKNTTIGFLVNGTYNPRRWENNGRADILNGAGGLDSFNVVQTINRDTWKNLGANINFRRVLNANGRELTADLDRIQYNTRTRQTSDNYTYLPDNTYASDPFLLRGNLPADITIYSGKVDYVHPIDKESKIEAGAKSSYVVTDNDAQYTLYSYNESKWVNDYRRSNRFKYRENINAAYVNYSRQIKKWGIQTGLRVENTIAKGHQLGNAVQRETTFKKPYTQLFPTGYLSYALNDKNQFGLSYGRRIDRPNYQDMNPFQYFLDQYTYMQGNPNLTPQFTHNIELSHNYRKALNTTLSYTRTTDIMNDILKQNDLTKVTYQTKENVAKRQTLGLAVSYNAPITKWWTTSVFMNVNNSHYEGIVNNAHLDVSLTSFMGNTSQQFRFAKTWSAEVNGFYRTSAQETGLFLIRPMGVVSFGFGKQLMNNKASLKLNIYDPFYIQKVKVIIDHENIDAVVHNRWDNRRVGLNFTYRFSKGQNAQPQRRRTSSAQEEQNRVGGGNGQ